MTNHPFLAAKIVIFPILLQSLCQNLHFLHNFLRFCNQGDRSSSARLLLKGRKKYKTRHRSPFRAQASRAILAPLRRAVSARSKLSLHPMLGEGLDGGRYPLLHAK